MKKTILMLAAALLLPSFASAADQDVKTDDALYLLGFMSGRNLATYSLSKSELKQVIQGVEDAAAGKKAKIEPSPAYGQKLQEMAMTRWKKKADAEKIEADKFLAKETAAPGVRKLADGVWIKTTKPGTGAAPSSADTVKAHYEGRLRDGSVFDSSRKRGVPLEFPLANVIPCWQTAIAAMKTGETAVIYCSPAAAYGEMGNPPVIPGNSALVFETELIEVVAPAPAPAPAAKPADKPAEKKAPAKAKKPNAKK